MSGLHSSTNNYPTIEKEAGLEYLRILQSRHTEGSTPIHQVEKLDAPITWLLSIKGYNLEYVSSYQQEVVRLTEEFPASITNVRGARNAFDLAAADITYQHLSAIDVPTLLNQDFWRYLALQVLFEVIIWRIPDQGREGWPSNFGVGSNWTRCYPYKAYLRGHLISQVRERGLPWEDIADVDFYDSHLFARRNGQIPSVASALNSIRVTLDGSRALDPYATTAGRLRASHVTEVLSVSEIENALIQYTQVG